jgi:hypothetical protein
LFKEVLNKTICHRFKVRLCFVTDLERGHTIQQIRADASEVSGLSSFLKVTSDGAAKVSKMQPR